MTGCMWVGTVGKRSVTTAHSSPRTWDVVAFAVWWYCVELEVETANIEVISCPYIWTLHKFNRYSITVEAGSCITHSVDFPYDEGVYTVVADLYALNYVVVRSVFPSYYCVWIWLLSYCPLASRSINAFLWLEAPYAIQFVAIATGNVVDTCVSSWSLEESYMHCIYRHTSRVLADEIEFNILIAGNMYAAVECKCCIVA